MKRLKQRGFTLIELITVGGVVASLATACGVIYVAVHFAAKFW